MRSSTFRNAGGCFAFLALVILPPAWGQVPSCPSAPQLQSADIKAKVSASLALLSKLISSVGGGVEYERSASNALAQFNDPDEMYKTIYVLHYNCSLLNEAYPTDPLARLKAFNELFFKLTNRQLSPDPATAPTDTLRVPAIPRDVRTGSPPMPTRTAALDKPAAVLPGSPQKDGNSLSAAKLTPRQQWAYLYLLPTVKGRYHVIVSSIPTAQEQRAYDELRALQERYPNVAFALFNTLGPGNKPYFAIVIGSGLSKNSAVQLRDWARTNGLRKDSYEYLQDLSPECVSKKAAQGWAYKCE